MVWQGILQSCSPSVGLVLFLVLKHRFSSNAPSSEHPWWEALGRPGVYLVIAFIPMMWMIPYGALVLTPLFIGLSILSPAGRLDWRHHGTTRIFAILCGCLLLGSSSVLPVEEPPLPPSWGQPDFLENPYAPLFPASQQYTWLLPSLEIVQSLSIRIPHQTGPFMAESSTLDLAFSLGMHEQRSQQMIELLDDQINFVRLDPNDVKLNIIPSQSSHRYIGGEQDVELTLRLMEVRTLAFGSNLDGSKVGEIVCVGHATWGGQLDILIVVRPLGHPGLDNDPFAEAIVLPWHQALQERHQ